MPDTLQVVYYIVATIGAVGSIAASVLAWNAKQAVKGAVTAAAAAKVDPLEKEVFLLRDRVRTVEQALAALPTQNVVHAIEISLTRIEGQLKETAARLAAVSESAGSAMTACERIEGFFLQRGMTKG